MNFLKESAFFYYRNKEEGNAMIYQKDMLKPQEIGRAARSLFYLTALNGVRLNEWQKWKKAPHPIHCMHPFMLRF